MTRDQRFHTSSGSNLIGTLILQTQQAKLHSLHTKHVSQTSIWHSCPSHSKYNASTPLGVLPDSVHFSVVDNLAVPWLVGTSLLTDLLPESSKWNAGLFLPGFSQLQIFQRTCLRRICWLRYRRTPAQGSIQKTDTTTRIGHRCFVLQSRSRFCPTPKRLSFLTSRSQSDPHAVTPQLHGNTERSAGLRDCTCHATCTAIDKVDKFCKETEHITKTILIRVGTDL